MTVYQNRIRRKYLRRRTVAEMVLASIVMAALILITGISCSFGGDWDGPPMMVGHKMDNARAVVVTINGEPEIVEAYR